MAPAKSTTSKQHADDDQRQSDDVGKPVKGSKEYEAKRGRNNVAVKKSRVKSRERTHNTQERVAFLRQENETLEQRVSSLNTELALLKELFVAHAYTVPDSRAAAGGRDVTSGEVNETAVAKDHEYSASCS